MLDGQKESQWEWIVFISDILWFMISSLIAYLAFKDAYDHIRKIRKVELLAGFLNSGCTDAISELPASMY